MTPGEFSISLHRGGFYVNAILTEDMIRNNPRVVLAMLINEIEELEEKERTHDHTESEPHQGSLYQNPPNPDH